MPVSGFSAPCSVRTWPWAPVVPPGPSAHLSARQPAAFTLRPAAAWVPPTCSEHPAQVPRLGALPVSPASRWARHRGLWGASLGAAGTLRDLRSF